MSIPFTQYLLPDGHCVDTSIDMPAEIEELAQKFIIAGGRFEAEILTTGHVSITAAYEIDGELQDIAIKVAVNGPPVVEAVEYVVRQAVKWLEENKK
jgi:hypothetical protein